MNEVTVNNPQRIKEMRLKEEILANA